jgi:release factor glutamine methyltransferase
MDINEALRFAEKMLLLHTCEGSNARREAEELLAFSLGIDKTALVTGTKHEMSRKEQEELTELLSRRLDHEPLARILGKGAFMGRDFMIDRHTLVPRPATEIIVEQAISAADPESELTVLDIGTGSGCIAISMASALPNAQVMATDISQEALEVATRNALAHHVSDRVDFFEGNLLSPLPQLSPLSPLLIMANLPYIPSDQIYYLSPCVTAGEPLTALDGGPDGLVLYRRMLDQLDERIRSDGATFYMELLPGQIEKMKEEIKSRFPEAKFSEIRPGDDMDPIGLKAEI